MRECDLESRVVLPEKCPKSTTDHLHPRAMAGQFLTEGTQSILAAPRSPCEAANYLNVLSPRGAVVFLTESYCFFLLSCCKSLSHSASGAGGEIPRFRVAGGSRATRTLPVVFRFNRSGGVSRRVIDELPTMQEFEDRVRIERCSFPFGLARLAEKNHLDCYSSAR